MCTGSKPKVPPPSPPPVVRDEADAYPTAQAIAGRASPSMLGYRQAFLSGPRGPGGPAWQAPETPRTPPPSDGTLPPPRAVPGPGRTGMGAAVREAVTGSRTRSTGMGTHVRDALRRR